jgi:hypothetical protein
VARPAGCLATLCGKKPPGTLRPPLPFPGRRPQDVRLPGCRRVRGKHLTRWFAAGAAFLLLAAMWLASVRGIV